LAAKPRIAGVAQHEFLAGYGILSDGEEGPTSTTAPPHAD
jgi:hypothetical protein